MNSIIRTAAFKMIYFPCREVTTLVNEEKPAGRYQVNFNGSNLSSGVYLYRIEAGENTVLQGTFYY